MEKTNKQSALHQINSMKKIKMGKGRMRAGCSE
jgi:hypothetical protein